VRTILFLAVAACAKGAPPVVAEAPSSSGFVLPNATAPANKPANAVETARDAIATFRAAWSRDVLRHPVDRDFVNRMDSVIANAPQHFSAKRSACSEERERVSKFFVQTRYDFTTYGSLDALDRAGDCFVVDYIKGIKEDLEGFVSPEGELLFIWRIPEG
jgi:hypothetical protein